MITEMFIAFCLFGLFSTLITLKLFNTHPASVTAVFLFLLPHSARAGGVLGKN